MPKFQDFQGPLQKFQDSPGLESKFSNSWNFQIFKDLCEPCDMIPRSIDYTIVINLPRMVET